MNVKLNRAQSGTTIFGLPLTTDESNSCYRGDIEALTSDKCGFESGPVHAPHPITRLHVSLGLDHGGQVGVLVHGRPHPAPPAPQLLGHALPLPVEVGVLSLVGSEVPRPPPRRPVFCVRRVADPVQIEGPFRGVGPG